jgi:hypothetical protein
MDNEDTPVEVASVDAVLKAAGEKRTLTLYGYCEGCGKIHGDIGRLVEYLQFLSDMSMINFN